MVDVALTVGRLAVALVLVLLNGFFVASEFAFVRVRATAVEQLAAEGRTGAGRLQAVMGSLDDYLAVTQLGITTASLGLGWAGEPAVAALIEPVLGAVLPSGLVHLVAFALGFGFITFLHVVFGELAPKTIAISEAERVALAVAAPMTLCYYLFYPGLVVFNGTANAVTGLLGVPPASETDETLEEREIRRVLARAGEEGNVDDTEVEMIERVFEMDDTTVREVLVPAPDVVTVDADASLADLRATVAEAAHTRYPVVAAEDRDRVLGFVDAKDVLGATHRGEEATAGDLAREVLVVPETVTVDHLLRQFRDERQQMAAVIDEWGAFEGVATVEDVVEAVVGDLRDEFDADEPEPTVHRRADGDYDLDGGVPLTTAADVLGADFADEPVDTVGGLVLDRLGRVPEPGDTVETADYTFEIREMDGSRVRDVRARPRNGAG